MRLTGRSLRIVAIMAVLAVLAASGFYLALRPNGKTVTAYFPSATALYAGNPVKILGVPVGTITEVTPQPGRVRVVFHLPDDVTVPADVHAAQVSPSLISGRFVALTPPYSGGPTLRDGAVIPRQRTQVPLDVNDLYRSVDKLAKALGPQGVNKNGALSEALRVAARNLNGNGRALANLIDKLADGTTTLAGSRKNIEDVVTQLGRLVSTLADKDPKVAKLNKQLATVVGFLAEDRDELGAALNELTAALGEVTRFVRTNRDALQDNVNKLSQITEVLVKQRRALGSVVDEAALGLSNLLHAYDAAGGTLDIRVVLNELRTPPLMLVCKLLRRGSPPALPDNLTSACGELGGLLGEKVDLPSAGQVIRSISDGELPPVPGLVLPTQQATKQGGGR